MIQRADRRWRARSTAASTFAEGPRTDRRRTLSSAWPYHVRHAARISGDDAAFVALSRRAAPAPAITSAVATASRSSAEARNHALVATATPTLTISATLVLSGRSRLVW